MNNLYFIESDNITLINEEVKKILKENNFSFDELIKYDLSITSLDTLINEIDTYSIFQEKKTVLGTDAVFLSTSKSEIEQNIKLLENYINNPHPTNILILTCNKLDGKKNIVKLIKKTFKFIDTNVNYSDYIKKNIDDYQMSEMNINYFLTKTGENLERINNELLKLKALKQDEKIINKEDIDAVVIPITDDNIFALMDALIKKNKPLSFKLYQDLINNKVEDLKILINLSYQFRLIYQVKVLQNKSDNDIASILSLKNPKQVTAIRYKIRNFSSKELLNNLYQLALIDEQIKTSKILSNIAIPMFIANL